MNAKIYVSNLAYDLTNADLLELFATCGETLSAKIVMDRESGQSRGIAFVEMATAEIAQSAILALHGHSIKGRSLNVSIARAPLTKAAVAPIDQPPVKDKRDIW